jgi:hypothetical protein
MQLPAFIGPSYTLRSVNVDCQRSVNLYPEVNELGTGKGQELAAMLKRPGLLKITTLGLGPNRALYQASNGRVFAVSGLELYEVVSSAGVLRGTLEGTGAASIADNGHELLVVSGGLGYVLTFADNTFAKIADENFPNCSDVQFLDQYLIVNDRNTGNFQFSALSDATDWDGLDIAAAEGSPDNLITLLVDHRELVLFGEQTTEVWFNDGVSPFSRISGAFIEHGIVGEAAKAKLDNGVFFWSQDKNGNAMAMRINGYNPQRVSTHAVEQAVNSYGDISDATCYTYQSGGHSFWVTNFPSAKVSWVFDAATQLWHERTSGNGRFRAENHCFDGSRHLVGDFENGNLYELSESTYTDNGSPIRWMRRSPHLSKDAVRISCSSFQLDMETGVGIGFDDPKVCLRFSDDGGHTWSNEKWRSAGKTGQFKKRVKWNRLGQFRDRVWEVSGSDPVKTVLISAYLELN